MFILYQNFTTWPYGNGQIKLERVVRAFSTWKPSGYFHTGGLVLRNQSHCLNHQYSSLYRYMVSKHRLGTEKPVTLSEPCIQPITQVLTMHTAHYKRLCSENTGYVLRNQSHCLNHAYSPLHRSEPCIQLIIKRTMFWKHRLGTEKPVTLSEPCI